MGMIPTVSILNCLIKVNFDSVLLTLWRPAAFGDFQKKKA